MYLKWNNLLPFDRGQLIFTYVVGGVQSPSISNWYYKAVTKALEGEAKRKYFEHAGALLTADGTDDDLIKLEGTPAGYKLVIPAYNY